MKGLKYARQLLVGYADPRVTHLDADERIASAAANQNPSPRRRVLDRIVQEIAEHGLQQHGIAHDRSPGRAEPQVEPLLRRRRRLIATQSCKKGLECHRYEVDARRPFIQAQRFDKTIKLARELCDGRFSAFNKLPDDIAQAMKAR
jgi:hypothetical protein